MRGRSCPAEGLNEALFLHPIQTKPAIIQAVAFFLAACLLLAGVAACSSVPSISRGTETPPATGPAQETWYGVYFTEPGSSQAKAYRGGPAEALVEAIDQARLSVDVAAYDLNLWGVRDALLAAQRRGVVVRIVTDRDNLENPEIVQLIRAGIPLTSDDQGALMHHKFVIVDRREVWTGSMNLTVNSAYRNNDNLVRVRSADLADDYLVEFNEMFVDRRFGPDSRFDTPHPSLVVQGTPLEAYFSPDDGVSAHLVELIGSARQSIHFLAYSFTSNDLAEAILERARAGIAVSGVMESQQVSSNTGGEYQRFTEAGLNVRLDGNPHNMHDKVIIIDGKIVVTGSYNFSANAERKNDENVLVIHNPEIAAQYLEEFYRLFNATSP